MTDKVTALKGTFELINSQLYSVEERIRQQARAFDPAVEGVCRLCHRVAWQTAAPGAGAARRRRDREHLREPFRPRRGRGTDPRGYARPRRHSRWRGEAPGPADRDCQVGQCDLRAARRLPLRPRAQAFDGVSQCGNQPAYRRTRPRMCAAARSSRRSGVSDLKLSVPDYYKIIEMKTAALFAVATETRCLPSMRPRRRSQRLEDVWAAPRHGHIRFTTIASTSRAMRRKPARPSAAICARANSPCQCCTCCRRATRPSGHRLSEIILNGTTTI